MLITPACAVPHGKGGCRRPSSWLHFCSVMHPRFLSVSCYLYAVIVRWQRVGWCKAFSDVSSQWGVHGFLRPAVVAVATTPMSSVHIILRQKTPTMMLGCTMITSPQHLLMPGTTLFCVVPEYASKRMTVIAFFIPSAQVCKYTARERLR